MIRGAGAVVLCALGVAVASSCGAEAIEEPLLAEPPQGTGPLDALSRRFGQLRGRMRDRGYGEEVGLMRVFVPDGEGHVTPLDLPRGRCTTLVALAGGTLRSLSAAVYDADGAEVASDRGRSEGGVVHVCPPKAPTDGLVPHYFVLRSLEGSGAVVAGAFASDPGVGRGFDALFDGLLAPVVPFRGVEEALARSKAALRDRGLTPVGDARFDSLAEGEAVRLSHELEAGRCYVAIARGDDGLEDVDLTVYDPGGAVVSQDLAVDIEPTLELCVAETGPHVFEAKVFAGAGAVGLMALSGGTRVDPASEETETEELAVETADAVPAAAVAAVTRAASTLAERGFSVPTFITREASIAPGEAPVHDLVVERGCVIVLGAAASDETDLDLYLTSDEGVQDRDTGVHRTARVRVCSTQANLVRVAVKAYGRRSAYALAAVSAPDEIENVRALRLENAAARFLARGFVSTSRSERALDEGQTLRLSAVVRSGQCAAWVIAGDEDIEDVDLFLKEADGTLVAAATGPEPFATVSRCVAPDAPAENILIEGLLYRGEGTVTMTRLGRVSLEPDAATPTVEAEP